MQTALLQTILTGIAMLLIPAGVGMNFMPIVAAATSGVPVEEAGLASGLITTSQQMGGAVGLAILSGFTAGVAMNDKAQVAGFDRAFLAALAFIAFAFLIALFFIREKPGERSAAGPVAIH